MNKKVLVTGSEGYIGSVLVPFLIGNGFDVVGLDTCFYQEGNLNNFCFPEYSLIKKDIRQLRESDLRNFQFDSIIHLAALSNDPLGTINEDLTYDINYQATVKLAKIAKDLNISKFIFASSCSLYGQGGKAALTEEAQANPQTAYGKSKILAEKALSKLADDTFCPVFMRNATAYGFSPRMRFDIVVNNLTGFAKVENEIKILGDGKPWRPIVHVSDICNSILLVLKADNQLICNQAFNVGSSSENYQIISIAEHCKKAFPECNITVACEDAGDTRDYNVSFKKIENILNYKTQVSLDDGINNLKKIYDTINLDQEFYSRKYTRLKQINFLLQNRLLDRQLFWKNT